MRKKVEEIDARLTQNEKGFHSQLLNELNHLKNAPKYANSLKVLHCRFLQRWAPSCVEIFCSNSKFSVAENLHYLGVLINSAPNKVASWISIY